MNSKLWITIGIVAVAGAIGVGSYYIWGPDNAVEEVCESVIQTETGANVDLSPVTPEAPK
jgi:hypothetical protein